MRSLVVAVALMGVLFLGCMSWDPSSDDAWEEEGDAEAGIIPRSEMKNPWADSKVGDWVMTRGTGIGARQIKTEVVRVSDREVLLLTGNDPDDVDAYTPIDLQEEEQGYKDPRKLDGFVSIVDGTMELGGKTIKTQTYTLENEDKSVRIVNTMSDEVPLDGMIKSVRNGKIGYEIIDFNKN